MGQLLGVAIFQRALAFTLIEVFISSIRGFSSIKCTLLTLFGTLDGKQSLWQSAIILSFHPLVHTFLDTMHLIVGPLLTFVIRLW